MPDRLAVRCKPPGLSVAPNRSVSRCCRPCFSCSGRVHILPNEGKKCLQAVYPIGRSAVCLPFFDKNIFAVGLCGSLGMVLGSGCFICKRSDWKFRCRSLCFYAETLSIRKQRHCLRTRGGKMVCPKTGSAAHPAVPSGRTPEMSGSVSWLYFRK